LSIDYEIAIIISK